MKINDIIIEPPVPVRSNILRRSWIPTTVSKYQVYRSIEAAYSWIPRYAFCSLPAMPLCLKIHNLMIFAESFIISSSFFVHLQQKYKFCLNVSTLFRRMWMLSFTGLKIVSTFSASRCIQKDPREVTKVFCECSFVCKKKINCYFHSVPVAVLQDRAKHRKEWKRESVGMKGSGEISSRVERSEPLTLMAKPCRSFQSLMVAIRWHPHPSTKTEADICFAPKIKLQHF